MCSNTSHSSSGGGNGGGGGGDNGGYGVDSMYSKKPRRQRVPKRGPGVAELEKILREQEKRNDIADKAKNNEGFSLVSSLPNSYKPQSLVLASSNSLPKPVSFAPNPNHFSPPRTTYYGNSNSNPVASVGKSFVQIGGSNVALPEHALLPTRWNSPETNVHVGGPRSAPEFPFSSCSANGSDINQLLPFPSLTQRSQNAPSSAKDLFPHSVVSSSTTPSYSVPCHGREPPSNQTTYTHSTSLWPEEDKIAIGAKRSRSFSMEIPPVPAFRYQVPIFSPPITRPHSSFSCGSPSIINLESSDIISREMKPSYTSLEPKIQKCIVDDGSVSDGNFFFFGCPTTPPCIHNLQRERPRFDHCFLQENNGGEQKKPFYSFLLSGEHIGMVESLNSERIETMGDGIDLSLKL